MYIYQQNKWPHFHWDQELVYRQLLDVRHDQGVLLGHMNSIGFELQQEALLQSMTDEIIKSHEIEGEILDTEQVRSSIVRRLDMNFKHVKKIDYHIDGIVNMMIDATKNYDQKLTKKRLCEWHTLLFPKERNRHMKIRIGDWRNDSHDDAMQIASGPLGKEKVHFQAPASNVLPQEMQAFLKWLNKTNNTDNVLKSAIAHLWFVTLHPFEDGNGRMARAITEMLLARSEKSTQRFYSMSAQIQKERKTYYNTLELTQKGNLDITDWITWFLSCLQRSIQQSISTTNSVMTKAQFWKEHAKENFNARQIKILQKLFDGFDGKLTTTKWAKICKCSHDTAYRDIMDLVNRKILEKADSGGRSTSYLLKK
ncbi:Fic family protein [bacterium]|nr:Fic family protein [bacterium]